MTRLDGKAIIITGAGQGIGAAHARLAARLGARVLLTDVDGAGVQTVAREITRAGGRALAVQADIVHPDTPDLLVARCIEAFGTISGLMNNAGVLLPGKLEEMTRDDLVTSFEVNVLGTAACTQAVVRALRARGLAGSIVNTTSGSHAGDVALGAYAASKGAVASLTYTWAMELRETPIRVNAISPLAGTRMAQRNRALLAEQSVAREVTYTALPEPEVNAPVACYLASDAAREIHGQIVRIAGDELSLVTHPMIAAPVLRGRWDIDAVAQAFETTLKREQQRLGLVFA